MVKISNALRREIEKVALSGKTLASFARKKETQTAVLEQARKTLGGYKYGATRRDAADRLGDARNKINAALRESRAKMSTKPIRKHEENSRKVGRNYG